LIKRTFSWSFLVASTWIKAAHASQAGRHLLFMDEDSGSCREGSVSHPMLYRHRNDAKSSSSLALSSDAINTSGGAKAKEPEKSNMLETLTVGTYFGLWYLFNIAYNIYNKRSLNVLDYPWTVATIQMAAGILYFAPLWLLGIRKAPKLSKDDLKTLFPIALCHTGVHVGAVIALGAGAVSFAHIVKASEPVVTCALNAVLLGEVLPVNVYLTLLPIIGGVAIASMKELSFTFLALGAAMLSNVSSAARGVLSKKTMSGKKIGENLDAQNLYAVLTAMSTAILIPTMLAIEGTGMFKAFGDVVKAGQYTKKSLATLLALGGFTYYAYNEVAFLALGKVNPVTHAVGNTIKRVVIIVASVIAFKTPMSTGSIIGSSIAMLGTLLYSLAMNASKKAAATGKKKK
jgi:solute carrier family 35 protein E1